MAMKMKRGLVAATAVAALLTMSACGSNNDANNGKDNGAANASTGNNASANAGAGNDAALSKDPITLKIFAGNDGDVTNKGIQKNEVADVIKEKFGITLDIVTGDDVKEKTMIAGGDLPDVMVFEGSTSSLANSMIKGGQAIALDDLIAKYGPNIQKYSGTALDVFRKSFSNGTNKVYFLPTHQQKANTDLISQNSNVGIFPRWDLYKDLGAPEMKSPDDLLNTLKQMQDKNPKTQDGKKVYALSAWTDWSTWPYIIAYPFMYGYTNLPNAQLLNLNNGDVEDQYTKEDGVFWNGIRFYNKAFRMGIFDPEGFTQKAAQYEDKVESGALLTSFLWTGGAKLVQNTGKDDAQMIAIPGPFPAVSGVYQNDQALGWSLGTAKLITSSNKYPERTMQMLDFLNSPEGARLIYNGVQGKDWDLVDGKEKLIGDMAKPNNKAFTDANGIDQYSKLGAFDAGYPMGNGNPVDLRKIVDPAIVSKADTDFAKHYGADLYPGQVYDKLVKDGKLLAPTQDWIAARIIGQPSDATTQILTKADQYFMANVARLIMAKDDADFDAQMKKALADLKNMGIDKAYDEMHKLYATAQDVAKEIK